MLAGFSLLIVRECYILFVLSDDNTLITAAKGKFVFSPEFVAGFVSMSVSDPATFKISIHTRYKCINKKYIYMEQIRYNYHTIDYHLHKFS